MSQFYGVMRGQAGEATRRGSKNSGLTIFAASWDGAIRVDVSHDKETGKDIFTVNQVPWKGKGEYKLLSEGKF